MKINMFEFISVGQGRKEDHGDMLTKYLDG